MTSLFARVTATTETRIAQSPPKQAHVRRYMQDAFPCAQLCALLTLHNAALGSRELAFSGTTSSSSDKKSFYARNRFLKSERALHSALLSAGTDTVHVGALYGKAERGRAGGMRPAARELVFDLDLTDYDDVRRCCSDARACERCWALVRCGVDVMRHVLKRFTSYRHLLFLFSGRRGVHCWVLDEGARRLDSTARQALLSYMTASNAVFLLSQPSVVEACVRAYKRVFDVDSVPSTLTDEALLRLLLPRLDGNVTHDLRHLIKAPFCPHRATGRLALPFDADDVPELAHFPHVSQLFTGRASERQAAWDKLQAACALLERQLGAVLQRKRK